MIRPLRTYHYFAWRILAVVLPMLLVLTIVFRPDADSTYNGDAENFSITVRKVTNDTGRLTVELKNPLRVPSCLVYITLHSKDVLVGKIDQKGKYDFEIPATGEQVAVKLYDGIHRKEIMFQNVSYYNE